MTLICEERRIPKPPSVFIRDAEEKALTWEYKLKQESFMRFLGHPGICNLGEDEVFMSTFVEKLGGKQFDVSALRIH